MAAASSVFPAFIRAEYDGSGRAFAQFEQAASASAERAKQQFQSAFAEVGKVISGSLSRGLNGGGTIDLGVKEFQQAAREARAYAENLKTVATAAQNLATRTGDTSEKTRIYVQALRAQAIEAQRSAQAADAQVTSYSRLQGELDRTAKGAVAARTAMRELYRAQIESANAEVAARQSQGAFNAGYAPGLTRNPSSAAASGAVFQEAFAREEAQARSLAVGLGALAQAAKLAADSEMRLTAEANAAWAQLENLASAARLVDRNLINAGKAAQSAFSQGATAAQQFERNLQSISGLAANAISAPRTQSGSLDIDVGQYRQAAAAAEAQAIALREIATAAQRAAISNRDTSEATRLYVQAARAAALEAENAARGANQQAVAMDRLQAELNQTRSATTEVIAGQRTHNQEMIRGANSARANKVAYVQLGQQLQDVAIQAQQGVNPFVILVQQGSQAAFAMSNLRGVIGRVATFLSGPWGAAVFLGVAALGTLLNKSKETQESLDKPVQSADSFGNAQSNLGKVMDLVTGKFTDQNVVLRETLRLQALVGIQTADKAARDAREGLQTKFGRAGLVGGVALAPLTGGSSLRSTEAVRSPDVRALRDRFLAGQLGTKADPSGIVAARKELDRLAKAGKTAGQSFADLYQLFLKVAIAANDRQANQAVLDALDGKGLDARLRRDDKSKERAPKFETVSAAEVGAILKRNFGGTITDTLRPQNAKYGAKNSFHKIGQAVDFVPRGGVGAVSKAQIRAALEAEGIDIKELLGPGDKKHDTHFHAAFARRRLGPDQVASRQERAAAAAAKAAEKAAEQQRKLEEFGERAAETIARTNAEFDRAPRLIDKAAASTRAIDDLIGDLAEKKPPNFQHLIADAQKAKTIIQEGLNRPYEDFLDQQDTQLGIQRLLTQGREDEAEAMQIVLELERAMGPLSEERKDAILGTVEAIRLEARETEIARQKAQAYLGAIDDIRSNIQQTIEGMSTRGLKSVGDFINRLQGTFTRLVSEVITEKVFGSVFRELEDMVKGRKPVEEAGERMGDAMDTGSVAVTNFASAVDEATARINEASGGVADAAKPDPNFDGQDIVVTAQRRREQSTNPVDFLKKALGDLATKVLGPVGKKIGAVVTDALVGAGIGEFASSIINGGKSNRTGAKIGGAIGGAMGKAVGTYFGGPAGGKIGQAIGAAVYGTIGGAIGGAKRATTTISVGGDGKLAIGGARGNSKSFGKAANESASGAMTTIERIAEALGATITGQGAVSIGVRDGKYRVDPTGRGRTKKKGGVLDFGDDAAAAVRAATLDLIQEGILGGLRASTQRLLQGAKDLDLGLERALKFENVFIRLKEYTDPVGAAVDKVNREFEQLKRIFTDAAASAEEFAALEQLYGREREAAIKSAGESTVSALKDLLEDLKTGENGLSLRDRLANARATFDPLAAGIRDGKAVDYEAFAQAARNVIEIQRQISGSQPAYFDLFNEIVALSNKAIGASQSGGVPGANLPSPFGPKPLGPANDNAAPVVSALDTLGGLLVGQLGGRLDAINTNLARSMMLREFGGGGRGDSFSDMRNF